MSEHSKGMENADWKYHEAAVKLRQQLGLDAGASMDEVDEAINTLRNKANEFRTYEEVAGSDGEEHLKKEAA